MKSLYVTSVERYSGKTATCLALGKRFQADGYGVGYFKPLSLQPWRVAEKIADEDAAFAKEVLGLAAEPWELSPVVVTPDFLRRCWQDHEEMNLLEKVREACEKIACSERDVLLLEGGGSLREGYVVGLPTPKVAKAFGSNALVIVKYRGEVRVLDDALTAFARLGELMGGIIINRVPEDAMSFVNKTAVPYLEKQGVAVLAVLPPTGESTVLAERERVKITVSFATEEGGRSEVMEVGYLVPDHLPAGSPPLVRAEDGMAPVGLWFPASGKLLQIPGQFVVTARNLVQFALSGSSP